jgi:glycosyltransferase involved in cell wall biosynthesis
MRIALLTSSYPRFPGDGTAPFIRSIAENLSKLGHEVEVVAPYDPSVARLEAVPGLRLNRFRYIWPARWHIMGHARSLEADVRLRPLVFFLLPFFLTVAFLTLWRVTRRQKSEVIYAHWVLPNGPIAALVAAIRGIPFILSLHGSDIYVAQRQAAFGAVARWVFRRAAKVTACSPELRDAALALGAPSDTLLLPWGADPAIFQPSRRSASTRRTLGWQATDLIVVSLGRMVYKKGFGVLLQAMQTLAAHNPQVRLVLAGDGPLRQILLQQANQSGVGDRVSFPGRISWEQVPDFLASADIFVLPSIRDEYGNLDGLPTVLLEAMSCGVPVIASDIGGVKLVIEDGQTGLLVPPGDMPALAGALEELIQNPEQRQILAQAARRLVETQLNWQSVASRIAGLLEQAVV